MSTFLFIDTSEKKSFIALFNNNNILELKTNEIENDHSRVIHNQIKEILTNQNIEFKTLDGVIVVAGPGSYTGLRVGISTAKGICFGVDIPLFFITNFEKLAHSFNEDCNKMTIIHARNNEFYTCIFDKTGCILLNQQVLEEEKILENSIKYEAKIIQFSTDKIFFEKSTLVTFEPKQLSRLILNKFQEMEFENLADAVPNYIKEVFIYPSKK